MKNICNFDSPDEIVKKMPEKDVKQQIIEIATLHFSRYGFHKTTMDEIARHLHKAKGVLYYYFKSKEELFTEVVRSELSHVKEELVKITSRDNDSLSLIRDYFITRLKLMSVTLNYHETLKADFFEKYHFVKDVRDDFASFEHQQLKFLLEKGNQEGFLEIKNADSTINAVIMLLTSIEFPLYLQNKYTEYEATISDLVNMIIGSLRFSKNNLSI